MARIPRVASVGLLFVAAVARGPAVAEGQEPAPVLAAMEWEPGLLESSPGRIPFAPEAPDGTVVPTKVDDGRYARIRMAETHGLTVAVDLSPSWPRIWVDQDFDRDLAEETRTTWTVREGERSTRRDTLLLTYADEPEPVPVELVFYRLAAWPPEQVQVYGNVHRRGEVVLGGRLRAVAVCDGNADLRFDDPEKDHVYVDLDGDGALSVPAERQERVKPGQPFRAGDEGWVARVTSPSGRAVEFTRAPEAPRPPPLPWERVLAPAAGAKCAPPAEPFEVLARRFRAEKDLEPARRTATVALLGRLGTKEASRLLLGVAKDDDAVAVRAAAVRALACVEHREDSAKAVQRLARGDDPAVAAAAIQALHGMDDPDRERVYLEAARSRDATVAGAAAEHLAYAGTAEGRTGALAVFDRHENPLARYRAYLGVRTFAEGPPERVMLAAAKDGYPPLQAQALRDLASVRHPETRDLALRAAGGSGPSPLGTGAGTGAVAPAVAQAVADVLGPLGDPESVDALLSLADRSDSATQRAIAGHLSRLRAPASTERIVAGLRSPSFKVRMLSARVLGGIPGKRSSAALLERMREEKDESVAVVIAESLADHADPASAEVLLARAKLTADPLRGAAIRALARLGLADASVRAFFLSLLDGKDWQGRLLAIDAVVASGDRGLAPRIWTALSAEPWSLRVAAAEALGRLQSVEGVPHLIALLEKEDVGRVRDAVARSLYLITGQNFYDDVEIWSRWWSEQGEAFTPPAGLPETPPEDVAGTCPCFYGIPVESERLVFVIDESGSMSAADARVATGAKPAANRLEVAVNEVLDTIGRLQDSARVNVITFESTVHPWKEALQRLSSSTRSALSGHLRSRSPTGGTNLFDALESALGDPEVDTVFLLSDGAPGAGRFVVAADILREVRRLNQVRRVAIHGISIGRDSDLLRRLAAENGGRYARR